MLLSRIWLAYDTFFGFASKKNLYRKEMCEDVCMSKGPYLKPCPFCGFTKPKEIIAMNEYWILCPQCKSSCGMQGSGITAITLWNNRPKTSGVFPDGEVSASY
jgi:hypothetical protein